MDTLINVFGSPDYIKIDVDGWELNVLKGLTKKVGMIAFEWIEEFKDKAIDCVQYLGGLGYTDFNWIHGTDDYKFVPKKWMSFNNFMNLIKKELNPERQEGWGMVYAK